MADSLAGSAGDPRPSELAGVVLAAGAGTRLRPLTLERPKALCPVGGAALVDLALTALDRLVGDLAVNLHHGRALLEAHLRRHHPLVHRSVEEPVALGTAGALAALGDWIDGRPVVAVNADAWTTIDLALLVRRWDRVRARVLVAGPGGYSARMQVLASLTPASMVATLDAAPSGLFETCWAPAHRAGMLEVIDASGPFVDCGTTGEYLRANLWAAEIAGGSLVDPTAHVTGEATASVIGAGAVVAGRVHRCVLWENARVAAGESLVDAIRTSDGRTVLAR